MYMYILYMYMYIHIHSYIIQLYIGSYVSLLIFKLRYKTFQIGRRTRIRENGKANDTSFIDDIDYKDGPKYLRLTQLAKKSY